MKNIPCLDQIRISKSKSSISWVEFGQQEPSVKKVKVPVWLHVAIPAQPKKRSDAIANCLQNAVCWLLASLKRASPRIECWSLPQIQCRIFYLTESASNLSSLLSQPHYLGCPFPPDVFHVIVVWTEIPASSYLGCGFPPEVLHVVFVWTQVSNACE
jgi:hypothetical protein